jgi:NADPH:quinone reductase-like Zn-dependent oxidoreductase
MKGKIMKAITYSRYGGSKVLNVTDIPRPEVGLRDVLVRVQAAGVTTADWRLRAAAFPGATALPGRLMFGLFKPRQPVIGNDFAGIVEAVGSDVRRFAPGDRVYGSKILGAHAEYLTIHDDAGIAHMTNGISMAEAAALPFGAIAALVFLRDFARVKAGQDVLILGASGGIGVYAVQIAKAFGARVTAVCSAENHNLVRDLGADRVLDYRKVDYAREGGRYDLVFDPAGVTDFRTARKALKRRGAFLPLNSGGGDMIRSLFSKLSFGKRVIFGISGVTAADLSVLNGMIADGLLRPVIGHRFAMDEVAKAHDLVEGRHRKGAVVLDFDPQPALSAVA